MAFVWRWGFQCSNLGGSKILHDPPGPSPNMGNPGHKGWRWRWDSPTTRQQRRLARPPRQPENLDEKRWTRNSLRKKRLWISTKNRRFLVRSFIKYFRLFTDLVQNISKKKSKDFEYQRLQNPNSSYIFGNKTYQSAKPHALVPVRRITNATLRHRRAQDRIQHVSHAQVKFTALPSVLVGTTTECRITLEMEFFKVKMVHFHGFSDVRLRTRFQLISGHWQRILNELLDMPTLRPNLHGLKYHAHQDLGPTHQEKQS